MSTSSIKKVSAAAIAAVVGLSGLAHAAPITLPYFTNFSTSPDSNGDTYTGGGAALQGQAPGVVTGTTGWVNENGEQNDVATVTNSATSGTVTLSSVANAGTPAAPIWSDVYNSNLADHPSPNANPGSNGLPLNSATYGSNIDVNYSLDVLGTGSLGANGTAKAGFGVRVLDSSDNLLAALFVKGDPTVAGQVNVQVQSGTDQSLITALAGPTNGTPGTYSIDIDFQHQDFQVLVNGFKSADIPFGTGETGVASIGGIAFSTDNLGTNTGVFSAFSVVPEPASFAMVGLGGLMFLAKRPKRIAE
jgi:hypothetical protein